MGKRKGDDRQLELFGVSEGDVLAAARPESAPEELPKRSVSNLPHWIDPHESYPHTDFMEPHAPLIAFLYPWRDLDALFGEDSLHGPWSVQRALLRGLIALGNAPGKRLRNRAFTIYMGDVGAGHAIFCVALGCTDAQLVEFMRPHLVVPGFETSKAG